MSRQKTKKATNKRSTTRQGRFSYEGLDRVLHEKARLGILSSLAAHDQGLLFSDLKEVCSLTDGNLSRHLQVLSEAGLIDVWKNSSGRRPQTLYRLTTVGRKRFAEYISVLEKVVAEAQAATRSGKRPRRVSERWSPA